MSRRPDASTASRTIFAVRLTFDERDTLEAAAAARGMTASDLVRSFITSLEASEDAVVDAGKRCGKRAHEASERRYRKRIDREAAEQARVDTVVDALIEARRRLAILEAEKAKWDEYERIGRRMWEEAQRRVEEAAEEAQRVPQDFAFFGVDRNTATAEALRRAFGKVVAKQKAHPDQHTDPTAKARAHAAFLELQRRLARCEQDLAKRAA